MKGVLVFIGDELISGMIPNTNSLIASRELFSYGFVVKEIVTLPDEISLIKKRLKELIKEYDFLILCGGLGPTEDDVTNVAVAEALELPLKEHSDLLSAIESSEEYKRSQEVARKMALLPKGAKLLADDFRMAGYVLEVGQKLIFALPGVPSQFVYILKQKVIPILTSKGFCQRFYSIKNLRFFDVNETDINLLINQWIDKDERLDIGYYPAGPEVKLILKSTDKNLLEKVVCEIKDRIKENLISEEDESLVEVVGKLLINKNKKIAVSESCTGGLVCSLLTSVPGSSAYFERGFITYSPESKVELLGIEKEVIERYGVVSYEVALEMAEKTKKKVNVDYGIGITGYAGPAGGDEKNPVGTVYIGIAFKNKVKAIKFRFLGERKDIQLMASYTALDMIRRLTLYDESVLRYRFAIGSKEKLI